MIGAGFTLRSSSWGRPSAFLQHLCHEVGPEDNSEGGGSGGHPAQQAGQPDPLVPPGQVPGSGRPQGIAPALPLPCPSLALPCLHLCSALQPILPYLTLPCCACSCVLNAIHSSCPLQPFYPALPCPGLPYSIVLSWSLLPCIALSWLQVFAPHQVGLRGVAVVSVGVLRGRV